MPALTTLAEIHLKAYAMAMLDVNLGAFSLFFRIKLKF